MDQFKGQYNFVQIWFNEKDTDKEMLKTYACSGKILEIGSFCGCSTCWWIENLQPSEIMCIDTWKGSEENDNINFEECERAFDQNVDIALKMSPHTKFTKIKGSSFDIVPSLGEKYSNYFDFIYIDGSHASYHVLTDTINCFKLLKVGGIMGFDDYEWAVISNIIHRPKPAIDCFLLLFSEFIKVTKKSYQVWIQKIRCPYT